VKLPRLRFAVALSLALGLALGLELYAGVPPRPTPADHSVPRWCARALRVFAHEPTDTLDLLTLRPECAAFVIERRAAHFEPRDHEAAR